MPDRDQSLRDRRAHSSSSAYADFHVLALRGWMIGSVRPKHAEILCDQFFIVQDLAGLAGKNTASGVENDRLIRHIKRQLAILFDQDDGLSFLLQPPDGAADFRDNK